MLSFSSLLALARQLFDNLPQRVFWVNFSFIRSVFIFSSIMAPPKRQRGESSTQTTHPYDRRRFVSEEVSDLYHDILQSKTLIP